MRPAPELSEQRLALVVATTTYTDPDLKELRSPAKDATDMADVLADPAIGGFTVTPVVDRPEYEIRRAIDAFLADRTVDDLVLIYLSCHGILDARGRLYFAATDSSRPRLNSTAVESTWLLDRLEECRARRQVLILDCCFSGAFANIKGDLDLENRLIGSGRGRAVLTASRATEYSYEGEPLTGEPNSVFTAALIDGLRTGKADSDQDGYISVEDAYSYAADKVRTLGGSQTPQRWLYGGEDAIILARNPHGAKIVAAPIPEALQISLESPYSQIRVGAVHTLGTMLTSTDPGQVLAAQQTLHKVAAEDNPTVAAVARQLLPATDPPKLVDAIQSPSISYRHLLTLRPSSGWLSKKLLCVAFSPSGRLASGSSDRSVRLWIPTTGQPASIPTKAHFNNVNSVAFNPSGALLASASHDGTIRLWDGNTGQPISHPLNGHTDHVNCVAFSPDGKLLASASSDTTIRLWDGSTGKPVSKPLRSHLNSVNSVAFSPDGRVLASASNDGTLRLWDPTIEQLVCEPLLGHTDHVNCVAFSPDGRLLASASSDTTVRLWNPTTGEPIGKPLQGHTDWVRTVAFSPDGRLIASAGDGKAVRLWDATTGKPIGKPLQGHTKWIRGVAFSPDGRLIASASDDKTVRIWGRSIGPRHEDR